MILVAALATALTWPAAEADGQAAAAESAAVVECRVDNDPDARVWQLVRQGEGAEAHWRLTLRSTSLGSRTVDLPLPDDRIVMAPDRVSASSASGNGGLAVDLVAAAEGGSVLDVFINYELEVNVWRDLSPDVEQMNTGGPRRDARCVILAQPIGEGTSEWTVSAGTGWGVPVFGYGSNNGFVFQSLSWGRVLTPPRGRGPLRGRFTWAIEVVPIFVQHDPERAYGFGFSPLVWRWSLEPRGRLAPFVELGGGGLWTTADVPGETTQANYTMHLTVGIRVLNSGGRGALLGYRFDHISNGNRVQPNPGVNAHVIVVGWTLIR